jgi:GAF domain-containing protein
MKSSFDNAIARLAVDLALTETVGEAVIKATSFAAYVLGTPHAGATMIRRGGALFETAGATDPVVERADELQHRLRQGPCVDAAVESRSVISNDLANDPRWPDWGPGAASLGLGSILSSEMHAGDRRIGALNVYGEANREFTSEDLDMAHVLAQHVAAALRAVGTIEGLTTALDSRTLIGQAQGVLMERYQVDSNRAFAILRRYSQDENVRLADVARNVVKHRALPTSRLNATDDQDLTR